MNRLILAAMLSFMMACSGGDDGGTGQTITTVHDSAGAVTISGTADGGTITLNPVDGGYTSYSASDKLWNPGATLTFAAAGATVPAFSAKTVVAPAEITLTAPT